MESLLYWSDQRPLYFLVAYGGAIGLCLFAAWPAISRGKQHPWKEGLLFLVLLGLWMVAARWPGLFYFLPFDPDEAQFVAAAQTLANQPVLYRMADGATGGPLVIYLAGISWLAGTVPSLFDARLAAVVLAWLGACAIYAGIKTTGDELAARLGALAAALFYGLTSFWNFVHYNSELLPSTLCAWATAGFLYMLRSEHANGGNRWKTAAWLSGFLLSMVPFSKLQAVPLALTIGVLITMRGIWILRGQWLALVRFLIALTASVLAFPTAFFLLVFLGGAFDYFFQSYISNNLLYAGSGYSTRFAVAGRLLQTGADMVPWIGGVFGTLLVAFGIGLAMRKGNRFQGILVPIVCLSLAGISVFCVLAPSRDYMHYLLLVPMPLSFAMGAVIAWMLASREVFSAPNFSRLLAPALLVVALLPFFFQEARSGEPWAGSARYWNNKPLTGIRAEIKKRSQSPSDGLLVWGYVPELNVTTGILQASRLSITSAQIQENALTPFYRKALMEDLYLRPPKFVVDAVCEEGFLFTDNKLYGPQCFQEFAEFLNSRYHPVGKFSGMTLYVRNGS